MSIVLEQLTKRYGGHAVVNHVSLEVRDGEFFVLLGPSGSGKSTVLRIIAGLTDADQGRVVLRDRDVTSLPPQRRGVSLVFQNYALFRQMTVAQNIEFPLRVRRVPAPERRRRRDELLELVGLIGLGGRLPRQLSGGQQQRVALARALAHKPEVLLLDEPFGALDARIRTELRGTVRAIQRELGITTIFVTHDQEEAFALADRIGVMNFGRLLETGPPSDLYLCPQTEFVATFLGTANLMVGERVPDGIRVGPILFSSGDWQVPDWDLDEETPPPGSRRAPASVSAVPGSVSPGRVQVLFRPEDVAVKDSREALLWPMLGEATVEEAGFAGSFQRLRLRLPKLPGVRPISPAVPFGADFFILEATRPQDQARRFPLGPGDRAWVGARRVHALTHPGLSFLLATDGTDPSRAALTMGSQIARLAHARVTLVALGSDEARSQDDLLRAREAVGSGIAGLETIASPAPILRALATEAAREPRDLVVWMLPARGGAELAEQLLQEIDTHLLLVPAPGPVPTRVLICVEVGEPGKEDVAFAARLVRHIGASATLVTVLPTDSEPQAVRRAERFLSAGARSLALLGVPSRTIVRTGSPLEEILAERRDAGHDLLVLGAPLPDRRGRISLQGFVGRLIESAVDHPVLIVRSHRSEGTQP